MRIFFLFFIFFSFSTKSQTLDYVFKSGEEGYKCFRIPTILKSQNGTLLAFAEGRKNSCSDTGDIDLVLKKWHSENKDSKETVKILYPLTVLLYDFENKNVVEMQMNGDDDFKALKEKCSKSKEKKD